MQGTVFVEFLDMAAAQFGADVVDSVLELADLESGGEYEEAGAYDPRELPRLVGALAKRTGRRAPDLMRAFGRHLFDRLAERQPTLTEVDQVGERWARLEGMLPAAGREQQKGRDSGLPTFEHRIGAGGRLEVRYEVAKPLADLADEFVLAASELLGQTTGKEVTADGNTIRVRLLIG